MFVSPIHFSKKIVETRMRNGIGKPAELFRIRIFGVPDPDFWRIFWIRSRIGYHFCSSRIRSRIIQNATPGKLFIFSRFDFFLQKLFDNLRLERSDAG